MTEVVYPPLGAYEALSLLGRGGMAEVFHVRHKLIGSEFALKRMLPELALEPRLRELFEQEMKALVKLRHAHVVEVYDVFSAEDGAPVIVMELLAAPTLRKRMEQRPLTVRQILGLAHAVASGLGHAHRAGIVHCDLKPDNVLLPGGDPTRSKIIDFGIAHLSRARNRSTRIGTIPYMSPEQLEDRDVDARTDLFALGVMLYEAMEGKLPVDKPSLEEALEAWRKQSFTFEKDAPRDLRELCRSCLAFDPEDRPRDADAVLHRLMYIESTERAFVDSSWNRRPVSSSTPLLAAGLFGIAASACVIFWFVGHKPNPVRVPAHAAETHVAVPGVIPHVKFPQATSQPPPAKRTHAKGARECAHPPCAVPQRMDEAEDLTDPNAEDEGLAND